MECWLHGIHVLEYRKDAVRRGQRGVKAWTSGSDPLPTEGVARRNALEHLVQCVAEAHPPSMQQDLGEWSNDLQGLRRNSTAQQLFLCKDCIEWRASRPHVLAALLLADVHWAPVKPRHGLGQNDPSHIVLVAPRFTKSVHRTSRNGVQVWFLCVKGATSTVLQHFLFQLGRRGALRWELPDSFKISRDCQGQGGQGAVFSGITLLPTEADGINVLQDAKDFMQLQHVHDFAAVAAKVWTKASHDDVVKKEAQFMQAAAGHPNVSTLLGIFAASVRGSEEARPEIRWVMVMELYSGGDVHEHATSSKINRQSLTEIILGTTAALTHLHALKIVHRDVKAENIVVRDDHCVLIDYGIAAYVHDTRAMRECVGSPGYAAPEVVTGSEYNEKVDIFSLGVLLHFLIFKTLPFRGAGTKEILEETARCILRLPPLPTDEVFLEYVDMMKMLLEKRPKDRPSALECFHLTKDIIGPCCEAWPAFQISMAAMVKQGAVKDPQDPRINHFMHGSETGGPVQPVQHSDMSSVTRVLQSVARRAHDSSTHLVLRISTNVARGMRHVPEVFRNVGNSIQMSPVVSESLRLRSRIFSNASSQRSSTERSVDSVVAGAVQSDVQVVRHSQSEVVDRRRSGSGSDTPASRAAPRRRASSAAEASPPAAVASLVPERRALERSASSSEDSVRIGHDGPSPPQLEYELINSPMNSPEGSVEVMHYSQQEGAVPLPREIPSMLEPHQSEAHSQIVRSAPPPARSPQGADCVARLSDPVYPAPPASPSSSTSKRGRKSTTSARSLSRGLVDGVRRSLSAVSRVFRKNLSSLPPIAAAEMQEHGSGEPEVMPRRATDGASYPAQAPTTPTSSAYHPRASLEVPAPAPASQQAPSPPLRPRHRAAPPACRSRNMRPAGSPQPSAD